MPTPEEAQAIEQQLDKLGITEPAEREFFRLGLTKEDLDPELEEYRENTKGSLGWEVIKHPLVFAVPYMGASSNARVNAQLQAKKKYAAEALAEKQYARYLFIHERPYRIQKLFEIADQVPDSEYWDLLGDVWTDSENLWQYDFLLRGLLIAPRSDREQIMNEEERELLASLPPTVVVYRGHQRINKMGWSWSLSHWQARWFAERFASTKISPRAVVRVEIPKEAIIAVFTRRNEFEVVFDHKKMAKSAFKTVNNPARQHVVAKMRRLAVQGFKLRDRSHHGVWHWDQVERNAIRIAKATLGADVIVCRLFAVWHDSQRENEYTDPDHGKRAADLARILWDRQELPLTDKQIRFLCDACRDHEKGLTSTDPTIGACWDADRLDLTRVGEVPDPELLSTGAAKQLIWRV